jgi:hypothetical protein
MRMPSSQERLPVHTQKEMALLNPVSLTLFDPNAGMVNVLADVKTRPCPVTALC